MNYKGLSNTKHKRAALAYCMSTQHILPKHVRSVFVLGFDENTGLDVLAVESQQHSDRTMQRQPSEAWRVCCLVTAP
jgi:hypothetical protein